MTEGFPEGTKRVVIDDSWLYENKEARKPAEKIKTPPAPGSEAETAKLHEQLVEAGRNLPITAAEISTALTPEDIEDWRRGLLKEATLAAFTRALVEQREREQGKCPAHYTREATCKRCGQIWLWYSASLLGCPWCHNRGTGKPIPRPYQVRCGDCIHFGRLDSHPHLGHCTKGQPESPARNYGADRRNCAYFIPHLLEMTPSPGCNPTD